ncbi:tRNA glutamyl-Q(34) synthetase GluQRS [Parvularcula sp. LCG005]|uniref:tRNA glutamyl-Q(34) synthetase GluQRS n=1 Tax=Parvularcula sp. LCG005 TaxID=3078805 RepID=UPI002942C019|nr:tRNA glutamyl-Q(34) synthetase GluQRS [Parvularcula sp. LCG005]WOI53972.1 tRNA glutamyl-Q(34) synthetase GluQRS [Parvularcula sp. LCG005]
MALITRFAPSPTGYLHLGHAYSALCVQQAAMSEPGGTMLLRIEDIDQTRARPVFEDAIYEDLRWLGLDWQSPVRRQSDHFAEYEARLSALAATGLVYRCFLTRREVNEIAGAPHGDLPPRFTSGPLPQEEEEDRLAAGAAYSWRLSMSACQDRLGTEFSELFWSEVTANGVVSHKADPSVFGDVILGRKDIGTSYHLASVHDDILQGITHIVRGEDLRQSADLHVLLYRLFGASPPLYQHHRLINDDQGERLAKRNDAKALRTLRDDGATPADIRRLVGLD